MYLIGYWRHFGFGLAYTWRFGDRNPASTIARPNLKEKIKTATDVPIETRFGTAVAVWKPNGLKHARQLGLINQIPTRRIHPALDIFCVGNMF
jgi:hypothetical protein